MQKGDLVLVYVCPMRLGGDFGRVISFDPNEPDTVLVDSLTCPDYDFYVDKKYLVVNPFLPPKTIWQKIKGVFKRRKQC